MSNYPPPPGQPPYPPQGQPPYPQGQPPYQQAPPPKKGKALMWTLIGCGGFLLIGIIAVIGIGWYGYGKMKQAGLDPELMKRNPTLAAAKIAMMNNPDVEYVSIDESKNTITIRDKKTGKEITINAEKAAEGKIVISEDGKEKVSISGDGDKGSIEIKTPEGTIKGGSNSVDSLPGWLPQYPGVKIEGNYSTETNESSGVGYNFSTSDSLQQVVDFFESRLKAEGFKITKSTSQVNGQNSGSVVANDANDKRHIVVNVSTDEGQTKVYVISQTNK